MHLINTSNSQSIELIDSNYSFSNELVMSDIHKLEKEDDDNLKNPKIIKITASIANSSDLKKGN